MVAVVLFGCTDELNQGYIPLRQMDVWDVVADSVGGIIGVSLWHAVVSVQFNRMWKAYAFFKLQLVRSMTAQKF